MNQHHNFFFLEFDLLLRRFDAKLGFGVCGAIWGQTGKDMLTRDTDKAPASLLIDQRRMLDRQFIAGTCTMFLTRAIKDHHLANAASD